MKHFGKITGLTVVIMLLSLAPSVTVRAQDPVTEAIRQGVVKVIKAIDLQMQRLQTKTIWLQNAQKVVENTMSELKLSEITGWADRQKKLYAGYFDELSKVKSLVSEFHRIREVATKQIALVQEYKRAYSLFRKDKNFTAGELGYMLEVYSGIIDASAKNLDQVLLIVRSYSTQMTDAGRLRIISKAADGIEANYSDLKAFNTQNIQLSLQRSKDQHDIDVVKQLYGLQ